jgi:putative phosphoesterase
LIRPGIADAFRDVAMILHAGDVGGPAILAALNAIAPTQAVYGNVDDPHDPALARERVVTIGRVTIHVSHGHELGQPTPELVAARYTGDVLVFGHTHKAITRRVANRMVIKPGAAGPRRFDLKPSVARLTIVDGRAECETIWLAV